MAAFDRWMRRSSADDAHGDRALVEDPAEALVAGPGLGRRRDLGGDVPADADGADDDPVLVEAGGEGHPVGEGRAVEALAGEHAGPRPGPR